jgi:hypothetical protein
MLTASPVIVELRGFQSSFMSPREGPSLRPRRSVPL